MNKIKIKKDRKYYSLCSMKCAPLINGKIKPYTSLWLQNETGEGMEIKKNNMKFYEAIDNFFQENF